MRFLDANIFIYAFYKPRGRIDPKARSMKEAAKDIVRKISEGEEEVVTTVVHISEVNNILKRSLNPERLQNLLLDLLSLDNLRVVEVSLEDYIASISMISETGLDANDCLALRVMEGMGIREIYSFDKGFERFAVRLPEVPEM